MAEYKVPELTGSDEYKQLMQQKRDIDRRLKELQSKRMSFGSVKLDRQRWYAFGREAYQVKIKKFIGINCQAAEQERYYSIIEDFNLKKTLEVLKTIIDDLVILQTYLTQEEEINEDIDQDTV